MELPNNIEEQIAEYLNLEFCSTDISEEDLEYVDAVGSRYFWSIAKFDEKYWATVEPYEDSYLIGITSEAPRSE